MKKIFTLLFLFCCYASYSQIYYDFSTAEPTGVPANMTVDSLTTGNTNGTVAIRVSSAVSNYTNASGTFNAGAPTRLSGFDKDTSTYFEFTITPSLLYHVTFTGISFGSRSTSTGPRTFAVRTSADAFGSDVATDTVTNNSTWKLMTPDVTVTSSTTLSPSLTIRLYGFDGAGNPSANVSNWRIDDLTVTATADLLLPLSLTSFKGALNDGVANLQWTSQNEVNVKGFSIEKSIDGASYAEINFVNAANSITAKAYAYTDTKVKSIANYYRLKIIDKDGAAKFSSVVYLNNKTGLKAQVFPNPTSENVTVAHLKAEAGAYIRIVNAAGKQVKLFSVQQGATQSSMVINDLPKGVYFLVYINKGETTTTRFIKQ